MAIDYGSGASALKAPVIRILDGKCGIKGTVVESETRQATEYVGGGKRGEPLWWSDKGGKSRPTTNRSEARTGRDGQPEQVLEFIFLVAVDAGRGYFTKYDDDGERVVDARGKAVIELRKLEREDVTFIADSKWSIRAIKSVRLNDGDQFELTRLSEADAEDVECKIEVTGHVDKPKRYNADQSSSGIDYGDETSPAPAADEAEDEPF